MIIFYVLVWHSDKNNYVSVNGNLHKKTIDEQIWVDFELSLEILNLR